MDDTRFVYIEIQGKGRIYEEYFCDLPQKGDDFLFFNEYLRREILCHVERRMFCKKGKGREFWIIFVTTSDIYYQNWTQFSYDEEIQKIRNAE